MTTLAAPLTPPRLPPSFLRALAFCTSLCLSALAFAADAPKQSFNLPADSAEKSLRSFSQQSGLEVIFPSKLVQGVRTNAVNGEMPARDALDAMLADTGLVVVQDRNTGAFSVRKETLAESKNGSRAVVETDVRPEKSDSKYETDANGEKVLKLDTFEVFGRKTLNMDIRRTRDDVQPYVVFDSQKIEQSGAANIEEFLKNRLPMNTVQSSNSQLPGNLVSGNVSTINLRGLGANQTLILVDGRRLATANISSADQPDINGIPMSAIARIEVLPSTGSGIYGGGATGGVINIITKQNYSGAEVSVNYGNTVRSDLESRRVDASAGFSLNDGRTRIFISASASDSGVLQTGEREFLRLSRALQLANNPAAFSASAFSLPQSRLSNIASLNGTNLVLTNGTPLNSPFTFIPAAYSGPLTDNGAALLANAGRLNYDLSDDTLGNSFLTSPRTAAATFNIRQELGSWIEVYGDLSWNRNRTRNIVFAAFPGTVDSLAVGPNNPFTTTVRITTPIVVSAAPVSRQESETILAKTGVSLRLGKDWKAVLDYSWSRSRFEAWGPTPATAILPRNAAYASGALNVMRDLNTFPLDFTPYLLPQPVQHYGPQDATLTQTSLRLGGPLWQLPGGPLFLSALGEHRMEVAKAYYQDSVNSVTGVGFADVYFPRRTIAVDSFYVEGSLPLFSAENDRPMLRELSVQMSARRDDYTTRAPSPFNVLQLPSHDPSLLPAFTTNENNATSTKYTLGFRYSPFKGVALRSSYSTGFLPPSIKQIAPRPAGTQNLSLLDPKRGGVTMTVPVTLTLNGDPNLRPEESKSWSSGLIVTPQFAPGFRVSIDYTEIDKSDEIFQLAAINDLIALEDVLPGRVTRGALSPADAALGYTGGLVTAVDFSPVNIASTKMRAFDFEIDYDRDFGGWGKASFYALATYQEKLARKATPTALMINQAGYSGGPLVWRGNGGVNWELKEWSFGWNAQFYDSYLIYPAGTTSAIFTAAVLNQGSPRIPSQIYHDVFVRYRVPASTNRLARLLRDSEVQVGIHNLFDRHPPIVATTGTTTVSAYSAYGDPRLARYDLTFRKKF